jgi:hypothetical protein
MGKKVFGIYCDELGYVIFWKASSLDFAGVLPWERMSMPTNSALVWMNLHFLSLTVTR